jgi:hypothetical protein
MKNVTITLPDDLARTARVEAAKADKSLSRFIADMLAERCKDKSDAADADKLRVLKAFWDGPGYPGISKAWKGRDALYAERDDKLLRRHESSDLQPRSERGRKTAGGGGLAEKSRRYRHARPKSAKPE